MAIDVNIWLHKKYAGSPISKLLIGRDIIQISTEAGSEIRIYPGDEQGVVNFKNQVLWAYEDYLRNKKELI